MTLSVPSALAALTRALMPPTAVVAVDQFVPPLLLPDDELDEQPAASSAAAAAPARANLYDDDLNSSSWKLPRPEVDCGYLKVPGGGARGGLPTHYSPAESAG